MQFLPHTVEELIQGLEEKYPHRCIKAGESPEEAHRAAGRREVVDMLLRLREKTEKKALAAKMKVS